MCVYVYVYVYMYIYVYMYNSHPNRCEVRFHCCFDLHFPYD